MSAPHPPPPPPPPHGSRTGARNGLPDGSYDIFIVPPHSSGGGFVYFPSLQTNRNSFLAGVGCTLVAVMIYSLILPALREFFAALQAGGGLSVILMLLVAGVAGWAWGNGQMDRSDNPGTAPRPDPASHTGPAPNAGFSAGFTPRAEARPPPSWQRSTAGGAAGSTNKTSPQGAWEKAREETRKKEEERKKAEDLRKKRDEEEKERVRNREKEARERVTRERREKEDGTGRSQPASPNKNHRFPTAKTATDDASQYSYRPYDQPKSGYKPASASSIYSESSYAPSNSTGKTTPPPSHRGPYTSKDPDKIVISAVYSFNNAFVKVPIAKLMSGMGSVTDGLILRITTEGLFIDDDVRGVPQREWDVKAWTLKLVETGQFKGYSILRASVRDAEGKRFVFVLRESEGWKVAVGLQNLRRGTQVRALGLSGMPPNEAKAILESMGFI